MAVPWLARHAFTGLAPVAPRHRVARRAYQVLVPIAEDSEEIETACITDVLVRAGARVTVASCSGQLEVKMSRGLKAQENKSPLRHTG